MSTITKIAVAGATGRLGRPLVEILEQRGHEVVQMSRSTGVDVITGEGLDGALDGVEVLIDASTGPSPDEASATEFFTTAAANLLAAAERAGVKRVVVVSIVGIDRFPGGYNAAKQAQERAYLAGPIPVRILRATQFHEFVEKLMEWGTQGDTAHVWPFRTQLVAARTVAERLADLATAADAPTMSEIAGPREERLVEAARLVAERRGAPAHVAENAPDDPNMELYDTGAALPGPEAELAGPTFAEWLAAGDPVSR